MIETLILKSGRGPDAEKTSVDVTPITVFVGPNNSGKSKVLREIEALCRSGHRDATAVVLEAMTFCGIKDESANKVVEHLSQAPQLGEAQQIGYIFVGSRYGRQQVNREDLVRVIKAPLTNMPAFAQWFMTHYTLMLDGRSRIGLVNQQNAGDLQRPPESSLQVLFRDNGKRAEVRRIVREAFGTYFVIDPTLLGQLRIRLSERAPENETEERGIHDDAVKFHGSAQPIEAASDGVKAFSGILTEVIAGDPLAMLIDEPEAFLHPSLAFKLGQEISKATLKSQKRVLASTHSPQFVMGCIQSGAPVNIVRLTFREGIATSRLLPSQEILELMRHPLLRSTGVISGLFYEFVVVTESDADRAFYQEINERLLHDGVGGIPNCLFLNAQNKQTVHTLIRPLRKLGIPTAAVVDVDVFKDGGANWANLLNGAAVPALSHNSLATSRAAIKSAMDATGKDMKRDGGVGILAPTDRQAAEDLLAQLANYGIFVVPGGELESWLKHLGAPGKGPTWLVDMFDKMGQDPSSAAYVRPTSDDVWQFLGLISSWLLNPNRKGIPG